MSSYPYLYTHTYTYSPSYYMNLIIPILAFVLILAGGLLLYFMFVRRPSHFRGAAQKLHDLLNFRTFYAEHLLRALYCISVVALAVGSLILLFSNFFTALAVFVVGNIITRLSFELLLALFRLCHSAQQIERKLPTPPSAPEEPEAPAQPQAPQQPTPPQASAAQPPVPPQPQTPEASHNPHDLPPQA